MFLDKSLDLTYSCVTWIHSRFYLDDDFGPIVDDCSQVSEYLHSLTFSKMYLPTGRHSTPRNVPNLSRTMYFAVSSLILSPVFSAAFKSILAFTFTSSLISPYNYKSFAYPRILVIRSSVTPGSSCSFLTTYSKVNLKKAVDSLSAYFEPSWIWKSSEISSSAKIHPRFTFRRTWINPTNFFVTHKSTRI